MSATFNFFFFHRADHSDVCAEFHSWGVFDRERRACFQGKAVYDRMAVVVGKHTIKLSDIYRDLRVTGFLNRQAAPLRRGRSVAKRLSG